MAAITAQMVAQLREKTGLGMMECKKALTETDGDFDAAVEMLRKKGVKSKDDRVAGEGLILGYLNADATVGALVELNSETDFVARNDDFKALGRYLAEKVGTTDVATVGELMASDASIQNTFDEAVKRIGERIVFSRFVRYNAAPGNVITTFVYTTTGGPENGGKIGVLVETGGAGTGEMGREVAMHISFAKPKFLHDSEVDQDLLAKEREIIAAQTAQDPKMAGKPEAAIKSAVEGRVRKFLGEIVLLNQAFIRDDKKTIGQLVKEISGASIVRYARVEVGESAPKPAGE